MSHAHTDEIVQTTRERGIFSLKEKIEYLHQIQHDRIN